MLEIATEVFCERGYAGTSMNEIAARCEISKPMLYLYFDSKEKLYLACVTFVGDGLIAAIEKSVAGTHSPTEQVLATAAGLFTFAEQRDRAWWGVIYGETMPADGAVAAVTIGYRDRIFAVVERAMAGVLPDPVDAEIASHALIGAGESLLRWWVDRPELTAADLQARLVRILSAILGATSSSDRSGEDEGLLIPLAGQRLPYKPASSAKPAAHQQVRHLVGGAVVPGQADVVTDPAIQGSRHHALRCLIERQPARCRLAGALAGLHRRPLRSSEPGRWIVEYQYRITVEPTQPGTAAP